MKSSCNRGNFSILYSSFLVPHCISSSAARIFWDINEVSGGRTAAAYFIDIASKSSRDRKIFSHG
jgi:hypothetical protein